MKPYRNLIIGFVLLLAGVAGLMGKSVPDRSAFERILGYLQKHAR